VSCKKTIYSIVEKLFAADFMFERKKMITCVFFWGRGGEALFTLSKNVKNQNDRY
jgi:hypothetical protein